MKLFVVGSVEGSASKTVDNITRLWTQQGHQVVFNDWKRQEECDKSIYIGPDSVLPEAVEESKNGFDLVYTAFDFAPLPPRLLRGINDCKHLAVPSTYCMDIFSAEANRKVPVSLVPHGVDLSLYKPLKHEPRDTFTFLSVGMWIPRKGFDILLRAFRNVSNEHARLIIKTSAENHAEALREARYWSLDDERVHLLTEPLNEGQMVSLYQGVDAFVSPSRGEGFCLPVLEAMACGVPVVVPEAGGSMDFAVGVPVRAAPIDMTFHGHPKAKGWEVTEGDLTVALLDLAGHPDEARRLGEQAASVARHYSWERTASALMKLLEDQR